MTSLELILPIAAHTKQRPRFGRGRAYTPAGTRNWEELLAWRFIERHGRPKLRFSLRVELFFSGVLAANGSPSRMSWATFSYTREGSSSWIRQSESTFTTEFRAWLRIVRRSKRTDSQRRSSCRGIYFVRKYGPSLRVAGPLMRKQRPCSRNGSASAPKPWATDWGTSVSVKPPRRATARKSNPSQNTPEPLLVTKLPSAEGNRIPPVLGAQRSFGTAAPPRTRTAPRPALRSF